MSVRVKICGITSIEGIEAATATGADAVGFVFANSPREVTVERALKLRKHVAPFMTIVAVFRYPAPDHLESVIATFHPDAVQAEPVEDVVRVVSDGSTGFLPVLHDDGTVHQQLANLESSGVPHRGILLEAAGRGGRGVTPSWDVAAALARRTRLVLAGGLTINNVEEAIRQVGPHAVDVSSGVESVPGRKDPEKIARFMVAVRRTDTVPSTSLPALA